MSPNHNNPLEKHKAKAYLAIAIMLAAILSGGLYVGYESMAAT